MQNIVVSSQFVKPYFIEELGCEGVSLHDIAKSLGVEFKHVKEKFCRMLSDNRVKSLFASYTAYNENNRLVESYCLATETAKFFVAKWDSEIGDAYCRYLIECEKVVDVLADCSPELRFMFKMDIEQRRQAKELAQVQATLQAAGSSLQDATLTSSQIQALEVLFSELHKVSNDPKVASRTKRAIKEQFLQCAKSGCTYKDVAAKHFDACVGMVKAQIKDQADSSSLF